MQTATIIGVVGTASIGTSLANMGGYTVPASTGAAITQMFLANKSAAPVTVTVVATNGTTTLNLAYQAPIAVGDTLDVLANAKIVLAAGWYIQALCSATASVDFSMSVTQFS